MNGTHVTYKHFITTLIGLVAVAFSALVYIAPIGRAEFTQHCITDAESDAILHSRLESVNNKLDTIIEKLP